MSNYRVLLSIDADKFLKKLDDNLDKRIRKELEKLKENPELGKPLTGKLAGFWTMRMWKFRAIYQIRHSEVIVFVVKIGHRKNIY